MKERSCGDKKLYNRGFIFVKSEKLTKSGPLELLVRTGWTKLSVNKSFLYIHPLQNGYIESDRDTSLVMIGHAYNPFTGVFSEQDIVRSLYEKLSEGRTGEFWREVNELTGLFVILYIRTDRIYLVGDAAGMQSAFYSQNGKDTVIASHSNLIGDLLDLKWDPYITELVNYRFFPLLGNALPGDLTQFSQVKRLVPNHYVIFPENHKPVVRRFFTPSLQKLSDPEIVEKVSSLMHENMRLIAKKWKRPAISMTGGCDSRTTLACTSGLYDSFCYFSYISSDAEKVDAEAAHEICRRMGFEHTIYRIPDEDDAFGNLEVVRETLFINTGSIRRNNPNDVRKRAFFAELHDFDVEVKSWASEIGRAYYSKRFHGRKEFGRVPSPRRCTTLYKFFLHNRSLVRKTDRVFADYLKKYFRPAEQNPLPWQEQFFWEFRVPSWNGRMITGEHRYSYDITIPYNNRLILEMLLSTSLENRLHDVLYQEIRQLMNPELDKTEIEVRNLNHTEKRAKLEDLYYCLHSRLPL